jgi:hypothetical protein
LQAVEKYFIDMGWLLPTFHKQYWIGLNATTVAAKEPAAIKDGVLASISPGRFSWSVAALPSARCALHSGGASTSCCTSC